MIENKQKHHSIQCCCRQSDDSKQTKASICYTVFADKALIDGLQREKDALEKTVALINGQMLLVEGGKRRLDDVVDDLQTEIVSLRQQLEEAEKK